jgi:hypothetical protein
MKWLISLFKKKVRLKLGDVVMSSDNFYGKGVICEVARIYDRSSSGGKIKYCRLEFYQYGTIRAINVTCKSCQKVNFG